MLGPALEQHASEVRAAERALFGDLGLEVVEQFVVLPTVQLRVRVVMCGTGAPVLLLHGVTQTSAVWAPLMAQLAGYRLLAVDLPGHGLSGPVDYQRGRVREHTLLFLDDLLAALKLQSPAVVAHSLGGMYALWYAAARPGKLGPLIELGEPAGALPGVTVRMPLSLLSVPVLGELLLRMPTSRAQYRRLLQQGLGGSAAQRAPLALLDALRLSGNPRTVVKLLHALNTLRRPRPETVMSSAELARIEVPTLFVWGTEDPYQTAGVASSSIELLPDARLVVLAGAGHAPWLDDAARCARLIQEHLS